MKAVVCLVSVKSSFTVSQPLALWKDGNNTILTSHKAQWEESFFPKTSVAIVILFWLKWAGYVAVAGLNLLAQLPDRRSPYGV